MAEFLVVGEGRTKRFYLTGSGADSSPRFKPGPAGRSNATRYPDRPAAEAAAEAAQRADRYGLRWRAAIA
ncbi:MAG: hypothetical protein R3E75_08260 [Steroidobacteraceae bacterium]|nr:hypothetical protein [Nevskiaceae bacterium]MCP5340432.1 hypothetical protein [Nevskiaceae bacterium]MCP5359907.1 hypothetical protein [Nevskiaceae bacterium]MCP5472274.1 hypothetical protein [Nevskiaceae bacterium]